ncbi:MAG: hypothetical protein EZS26_000982 [Candidatus Ordinivivax streblomastigis]|jgi:hypothetical protein|uniref:Uncharacterized protein n=1 Tax=Candidatus Ordinivivax streblomastigis TaxID=2540710 RepID=A0A5M8P393_9BACT|nr:MAG: hypothetical protein EZS26_000982 [Candidatus Ordinivivax streblomastigis]
MELNFLDKVKFKERTRCPGIDPEKVYVLLGVESNRFIIIPHNRLGTCEVETWHVNTEEFLEKILDT